MRRSFFIKARMKSLRYAWRGLVYTAGHEHNFRIHLWAGMMAVAAGFYFRISKTEWLWVMAAIGWVLMAEAFNTAIERSTDLKRREHDPEAGLVKDIAAGAVLIAALAAAGIGFMIFLPYIF